MLIARLIKNAITHDTAVHPEVSRALLRQIVNPTSQIPAIMISSQAHFIGV